MARLAVIDLGSNTFHLLIVDSKSDGSFHELYRQRDFTRLGEGGQTLITESAMHRAEQACRSYKLRIDEYRCTNIKVLGTEAIRSSINQDFFIGMIENILLVPIEIISGIREAELIYKGVKLLHPMHDKNTYVIIDIGGGSTEIIIVKNGQLLWSQSVRLGVAVMYAAFHKSDPISNLEISLLEDHIDTTLCEFYNKISQYNSKVIIGATGSFEVLENVMGLANLNHENNYLDTDKINTVLEKIINASLEDRKSMPGLPEERSLLIVVACILIRKIISIVKPKELIVTPYALKEGVLYEMLSNT